MRISASWFQQKIAAGLMVFMVVPLVAQTGQQPGVAAPQPAPPATNQGVPDSPAANTPAPPVGTAAAPYEKPLGVAASRPAGAVIAPARQHRARSILIKVGLIAAAAAAIGTVIGLSEASSSRPH
jgi:hypothetical protein